MSLQGNHIRIDPKVLLSVANLIQGEQSKIEGEFGFIQEKVQQLMLLWQGDSSEAFFQSMQMLINETPTVINILKEYVNDLNNIAQAFITGEDAANVISDSLPSDVFEV